LASGIWTSQWCLAAHSHQNQLLPFSQTFASLIGKEWFPYCCLNLHVFDFTGSWTFFHMFVVALHFLFCESSVHVLCPFISFNLNVFIINFKISFHNKSINAMSYGHKHFFLSECLFIWVAGFTFLSHTYFFIFILSPKTFLKPFGVLFL
jgi:hypothetical protein